MAQSRLLSKPFISWTIDDIALLSSWVNRLTVEKPMMFREDHSTHWDIIEFPVHLKNRLEILEIRRLRSSWTPQEMNLKVPGLLSKFPEVLNPLSPDELKELNQYRYYFSDPEKIKEDLQTALTTAQKNLQDCVSYEDVREKRAHVFKISSIFHYDIIRIHHSLEGHKRVGRLVKWIIDAQYGIAPVPVRYLFYTESLKESLKCGSGQVLHDFLKMNSQIAEFVDNYFKERGITVGSKEIMEGHSRISTLSNEAFWNFFKEPAGTMNSLMQGPRKTIITVTPAEYAQLMQISQTAQAPTVSTLTPCNQCGTKGAKKVCGNCHQSFYCNEECQRIHWKNTHKKICKKGNF